MYKHKYIELYIGCILGLFLGAIFTDLICYYLTSVLYIIIVFIILIANILITYFQPFDSNGVIFGTSQIISLWIIYNLNKTNPHIYIIYFLLYLISLISIMLYIAKYYTLTFKSKQGIWKRILKIIFFLLIGIADTYLIIYIFISELSIFEFNQYIFWENVNIIYLLLWFLSVILLLDYNMLTQHN